MFQVSAGVLRNKSSTIRAASFRQEFTTRFSDLSEQLDIASEYTSETDSQERGSRKRRISLRQECHRQRDDRRPCNRLEILQKALEHPERLLVNLDPADDQVLGFQVIGGAGCLAERVSILENNLMALNEVGNVILGRG